MPKRQRVIHIHLTRDLATVDDTTVWVESKHPRKGEGPGGGQFTSGAGGGGGAAPSGTKTTHFHVHQPPQAKPQAAPAPTGRVAEQLKALGHAPPTGRELYDIASGIPQARSSAEVQQQVGEELAQSLIDDEYFDFTPGDLKPYTAAGAARRLAQAEHEVWKGGAPYTAEHMALPKQAKQPYNDWEMLAVLGEGGRKQMTDGLVGLSKKLELKLASGPPEDMTPADLKDPQGRIFIGPNKTLKRAREKVEKDYEGDWSQLRDVVRATIAMNSVDEIAKAFKTVEASGLQVQQRPKDNFTKPTKEGYRDLNTAIKLPNGMVAELQYNLKPMLLAKEKAHPLYEALQTIRRKYDGSDEPGPDWDPADAKEHDRLMAASHAIYDPVWEGAQAARRQPAE
jgi:hypothetical protein